MNEVLVSTIETTSNMSGTLVNCELEVRQDVRKITSTKEGILSNLLQQWADECLGPNGPHP